jgi:hypothetical protein
MRYVTIVSRVAVAGLVTVGCGGGGEGTPEGTSDGSGSASSSTGDGQGDVLSVDDTSTTADDAPGTTAGNTETTSEDSSASSTGEPSPFACPPAGLEQQCSVVDQDCPDGFHCVPGLSDGGFDAVVCAPLAATPVPRYGACTFDVATCSDECEEGTYCWSTDDNGEGTCQAMCDFGGEATCGAEETCLPCDACMVQTCFAQCDPLAPRCPGQDDLCFASSGGFYCIDYPVGTLVSGDTCESPGQCAPGLECVSADAFGEACEGAHCCSSLCDVDDRGRPCSEPGHECLPYFIEGNAPVGLEHVGVCGVP